MTGHRYTVVAISGDNGMTYAVGTFTTRATAQARAGRWQERDNPDRNPQGMSYSVCLIERIVDWGVDDTTQGAA